MKVYLIKQHQTDSEYNDFIVAVVDSESKAKQLCREYNKEYAENVGLDKTGLFTGEYDCDFSGCYHYYDYFSMIVK